MSGSYNLVYNGVTVAVADSVLTAKDGINYIGTGFRDAANPWGHVLNLNFLTLSEKIKAIPTPTDYSAPIADHATRLTALETDNANLKAALTALGV
jgi:hypothetical protein